MGLFYGLYVIVPSYFALLIWNSPKNVLPDDIKMKYASYFVLVLVFLLCILF